MMNMRPAVLAIDPGKTTGFAFYDIRTDVYAGGEGPFLDTCQMLEKYGVIYGERLDLLSEMFLITIKTAKNTQATWSLEMIGVARYVSQQCCGQDLILRQQSAAKRFGTNDRLKALNWYGPGLPHMNDASRILLTYLVERDWWDDRLGKRV